MATRDSVRPQNYFLNEAHELGVVEKGGGGRVPEYIDISWARKASRLSGSIQAVVRDNQTSKDPLRGERYFVLARPVASIKKRSINKRKAPEGFFEDETQFGGAHGRVFDRLGLDLLQVTEAGDAVVHGSQERIEQLLARSRSLATLGAREQSRWVAIDEFDSVPLQLRVDGDWLNSLVATKLSDVVFELQPVLGRVDADRVLRAIADVLHRESEQLTGTGTDFSGRYWFRGKASPASIRAVAKDFSSVQAIHSPLYSYIMASRTGRTARAELKRETVDPVEARSLPCVAVVDLGVPSDHLHLQPYQRGRFVPQQAATHTVSDHASFVASRVVLGDAKSADELAELPGLCSFYDAVVAEGFENKVDDKIVLEAMRGVRGAAPDVRVFNLSFGDVRPLRDFADVEQREKRLALQDLDNFAFANDVVVVVAAGNSQPGVIPNPTYPNHFVDPRWALGPWACGFNTLVCGAYVSRLSANGLVTTVGYPSPFSRVGFGLCDAPVPSFCAEGGNSNMAYYGAAGHGVWGYSGSGIAEDRIGTSNAAPILAREAALTLAELQKHCAGGTQPFAVTARAFLALTATLPTNDPSIRPLSQRTLGVGRASSRRIVSPQRGSAVILWQGVIETPRDVVRVQFPVPRRWLKDASDPVLRFFVCYDPPVNETATQLWACRKVGVTLHTGPEADGIRGSARGHETYPLFYREYKLAKFATPPHKPADDLWVLEIKYDEVFDYPPGMEFDPRQRVAVAAEIFDAGAGPVDPQAAMQALDIASSMTRLSIQRLPIRNPIILRGR